MLGEGPSLRNPPRIAIFDVCDTLYRENTTRGFLRWFHEAQASHAYDRTERLWTSYSSPAFYLGAAAYHWLGRDLARQMLLLTLKGAHRCHLEEAAHNYVASILPSKCIAPMQAKLREHRDAGDRVVLVSNSLDLVISRIAENLGVDWHASRLGFVGDICTGRLERDLTGRKASELRRIDPHRKATLFVYTDNRTDLDLIRQADFATVILPPGSKRSYWEGHEVEFLET